MLAWHWLSHYLRAKKTDGTESDGNCGKRSQRGVVPYLRRDTVCHG